MIPIQEYVKAEKDQVNQNYYIHCRFCKTRIMSVPDLGLYLEDMEKYVIIHIMLCKEFKKDV